MTHPAHTISADVRLWTDGLCQGCLLNRGRDKHVPNPDHHREQHRLAGHKTRSVTPMADHLTAIAQVLSGDDSEDGEVSP